MIRRVPCTADRAVAIAHGETALGPTEHPSGGTVAVFDRD